MTWISVREILDRGLRLSGAVSVEGWIRTRRDSKAGISFLQVSDGSCFHPLQVVAPADLPNYAQGYRLGYGGGYFDRTLAALAPQPLTIGVAFELARLPTIEPQPHDVAMDFVVTEAGLHAVNNSTLVRVDPKECCDRAQRICNERGLPRPPRNENRSYSSPVCYASEFPGYFGESEGT